MKKRKAIKTTEDHELDKVLLTCFIQRLSLGEPVSGPLLCTKALEMNEKLGGWLHNFKLRHRIREFQIQRETLSANSSAAEQFKKKTFSFLKKDW